MKKSSRDDSEIKERTGSIFEARRSIRRGTDAGKTADYSISVANQNIQRFPTHKCKVIEIQFCTHLDISNNRFISLDFLIGFMHLRTLTADQNQLTEVFHCDVVPKLENLSVNRNNISKLPVFLNNLLRFFPNLKWLSMMDNPAAPSYFNGGSKTLHDDYRLFVANKMTHLLFLDCYPITDEERQKALARYGTTSTATAF